jgi:hypothetical protein
MASPSDVFINEYKIAAGEGAVLELKMRLLANKVPDLRPYVGERLEDVEDQIVRLFGDRLLATEPEQLRSCRQLRNKVLHCDFPRARTTLHELGAPRVRGGVREIHITDPTGAGLVKHLADAVSNKPGASRAVADLTSRTDSNIFGWLLELGAAGDFRRAAEVFRATCGIVDRLAVVADGGPGGDY